jgi:hypothetical protein
MFLVPILLVAGISISHVVTWYDMANPINWAIYLSVAIEVGAMTALVAASQRVKGGVWFMFGMVTFIQMVGNIFYSYKEINESGELFKSWVELTGPIWEIIGTEQTDVVGLKRWLALLEGGLLPIISLTSLHFFVKYDKRDENNDELPELVITNEFKPVDMDYTDHDDELFDDSLIDLQNDGEMSSEEFFNKDNEEALKNDTSEPEMDEGTVEEITPKPNNGTTRKPNNRSRTDIKRID